MAAIRKEIRIIGFDDGPFDKFKDKKTIVIGAVFKGGFVLDGIVSTKVALDGDDATEKLVSVIMKSRFRLQLRCILRTCIKKQAFRSLQ